MASERGRRGRTIILLAAAATSSLPLGWKPSGKSGALAAAGPCPATPNTPLGTEPSWKTVGVGGRSSPNAWCIGVVAA